MLDSPIARHSASDGITECGAAGRRRDRREEDVTDEPEGTTARPGPDAGGVVVLAEPRGFCAGVRRAIGVVEAALDRHGPPVYVRKEIVHNAYVVSALRRRGAVFVDSEEQVPPGSVCVFSAHGVSPAV